MKYTKVTKKELELIRSIVGPERLSTGESILDLHSKDESFHQKRKPDAVVWPLSAHEISQFLKWADEKRIPVTPWGAGTSLEGNPIPVEGGIVLDLQQMNHILELKTEDLQVRVAVTPGTMACRHGYDIWDFKCLAFCKHTEGGGTHG